MQGESQFDLSSVTHSSGAFPTIPRIAPVHVHVPGHGDSELGSLLELSTLLLSSLLLSLLSSLLLSSLLLSDEEEEFGGAIA